MDATQKNIPLRRVTQDFFIVCMKQNKTKYTQNLKVRKGVFGEHLSPA